MAMLDNGTGSLGAYVVYSSSSKTPLRALLYNSAYFDGTGVRPATSVTLAGISSSASSLHVKRLAAPSATSLAPNVTIGGAGSFDANCKPIGTQAFEQAVVTGDSAAVTLGASEAVIVYFA